MYVELFCAACAAIVWCHSDSVFVRQIAYNVMLTATFMTLLFNANPLMRFDGYYILSDLFEIPNLYPLGQQYTRHLAGRFFLGAKSRLPKWPTSKSAIIKIYGLLAFLWRLFVCVGIAIAASALFSGLGIALAIVSVALWLGFPLVKLVKHFFANDSIEKPKLLRFAVVLLTTATALFLLLMLPEPGGVRAPAVVRFAPLHVIRAPHAGFVEAVSVRGGETVRPGQPIAQIENYELERELSDLQIAIEQSKLRTRLYRDGQEIAAVQAEAESLLALQTEYDQRQAQLARAELTAPETGTILSPNVHLLTGRYMQEGEELLTIGDESNKELELSISQENVDFFRQFVGETVLVSLRSPGIGSIRCHLARIDPRGSRAIKHNALSAASGGTIAVQPVQASSSDDEVEAEWEFTEPRFAGIVKLTSAQSAKLKAGQTAKVRVLSHRGTLGQFVYRTVYKWLRGRIDRAIS
jgi:putative peptide zinc metalloprotease protein